MGTTESIFYDEQPQQRPASSSRDNTHATVGTAASGAHRVVVRQRPSMNTTSRQPTRRRRPSVPTTTVERLFPLQAQIWGLPGTGKRTLLQRLQGKDPFATTKTTAASDSTRSSPSTTKVVVAYQVPQGLVAWDRIQLQVSLVEEVDEFYTTRQRQQPRDESAGDTDVAATAAAATEQQQPIDFVVLLVDPRHGKERIQHHLSQCITTLLQRQGYPTTATTALSSSSSSSKSKKKKKTTKEEEADFAPLQQEQQQQHQRRPFCLCLALNFADQLSLAHKKKKKREQADYVTESDLQSMTMTALQEQCPTTVLLEPKYLLLQCTHMSLWNCYGLTQLHHFIYQCYLLTKQWQLQDMLQQVATAQQSSRQAVPSVMSYQEYVNSTDQMMRTADAAAAAAKAKAANGKASKNTQEVKEAEAEESRKSSSSQRRKIGLPTNNNAKSFSTTKIEELAPTTPSMDPTSALEAFLASSDDDNDGDQPPRPVVYDSSTDDDEDDDVFFDEAGRRQSKRQEKQATTTMKSSKSTGAAAATTTQESSSSTSSSISRRDVKSKESDSGEIGKGAVTVSREDRQEKVGTIAKDNDLDHSSASDREIRNGSPSDSAVVLSGLNDGLDDKDDDDAIVGDELCGSDNPRMTPTKDVSNQEVKGKSTAEISSSSESRHVGVSSPKDDQDEDSDDERKFSAVDIIGKHEDKPANENKVDSAGELVSPEITAQNVEEAAEAHHGDAHTDHVYDAGEIDHAEEATGAESIKAMTNSITDVSTAEKTAEGLSDNDEVVSVNADESLPAVAPAKRRKEALDDNDANLSMKDESFSTTVDNMNTSASEHRIVKSGEEEEEKSSVPTMTFSEQTIESADLAGKSTEEDDEFFIGGEDAPVSSTSIHLQDEAQQDNGDKKVIASLIGSPSEKSRTVDDSFASAAWVGAATPNEFKQKYSKVHESISKSHTTSVAPAGLSAAALAAIAAAQEEAQLMLHQQEQQKEEEKSSKKSRKEKKEKKIKKKKKSRRSET